MKISLAPFCRKLTQPFRFGNTTLTERSGYLLRATSKNGETYFSEASPLPGFSKESLEEVRKYLLDFRWESWQEKSQDLSLSIPSSVRMALEFLGPHPSSTVGAKSLAVSGVIPLLPEPQKEIRNLWQEGFRTFKFKITPKSTELVCCLISFLGSIANEKYSIRLDANQTLSYSQFLLLEKRLPLNLVEYMEDPMPLEDTTYLRAKKEQAIPIAIDQPLHSIESLRHFLDKDLCNVFLLKPMCFGGSLLVNTAAQLIRQHGKKYTIGSALETEVGLRSTQRVCLSTPCADYAYGVGTGGFFNSSPRQPIIKTGVSQEEKIFVNKLQWCDL